jgi:ferrochelatase
LAWVRTRGSVSLGRARWLQPYTSEVLAGMPGRGVKSVSLVCPGFAADCLETLEEIGMENRDVFLAAGGEQYQYIAALNGRANHVAALRNVLLREAGNLQNSVQQPGAAACCG